MDRSRALLIIAGCSLLVALPTGEAWADIPALFVDAEQKGANVRLEVRLNWYCDGFPPPACKMNVYRKRGGGPEIRLYSGNPGDHGLEELPCASTDAGVGCGRCNRLCDPLEDICPPPGRYTYRVVATSPGYSLFQQYLGDTVTVEVRPSSGLCVASADAVPMGGCACGTGARQALPHLLVFGMFALALLTTHFLRRRRGDDSAPSGKKSD